MALNFKIILLMGVLGINTAQAYDAIEEEMNEKYLTISSFQVDLVEKDVFNQEIHTQIESNQFNKRIGRGLPAISDSGAESGGNVGKIIATASDLVALGESVYKLVIKGKPNINSTYAPVSVMPKIGKEVVDILDTEDWKAPKSFTYAVTYKNGFDMEVVQFRYTVIYSYGGTYNGVGAYITAAQIIPESVNVSFGYDFSATMKVGGIQNHGKKANPLAGLILTMQYTVETVMKSNLETRNYHIMGNGAFKRIRDN